MKKHAAISVRLPVAAVLAYWFGFRDRGGAARTPVATQPKDDVAFMGSLLGFLVINFHPASIFLGDCGSLFVGFTLASLTLLQRYVSHASGTLFPVLMPVMVLALPILDTATVTIIRLREGRPIYVGDSRHLSHRLVSLGMSPRLAVLTIYLTTLGIGLGAVGLAHADLARSLVILVQALAVVAVVLILLFYERRTQARQEER